MATTRDPTLDNARALLITLVVVGHVIASTDPPGYRPLYVWIYSFHMAGFVLISGWLSKNVAARPRDLKRLVATLLVPYLVFQVIMLTIKGFRIGDVPRIDLVYPAFALWFLLALAFWRLIAPLMRSLRWSLAWAVAVSVIAPIDPRLDQQGSLARILGFLPFFVLGLSLRSEHLEVLRRRWVRVASAVGLVGGLVAVVVLDVNVSSNVLQLDSSYPPGLDGALQGATARVALLAIGTLGGLAVLSISSSRPRWYTGIGERSLVVYLLHAVIVYAARDIPGLPGGVLGAVAVGVALTVVLGSPLVERATRWLVAPRWPQGLVREVPSRTT